MRVNMTSENEKPPSGGEHKWKKHDGGPRPFSLTYPVAIKFRDGEVDLFTKAGEFEWRHAAQRFGRELYPEGHFADIVEYGDPSLCGQ